MDATRFDRFAKLLAGIGTRRGLLCRLAALPILGGLALVGEDEAAAKDRRRRRKARHRRRTGKHKRKRPTNTKRCKAARLCAGQCGTVTKKQCKPVDCGPCACIPDSDAQTCAGRCATVTNNCQQAVDCGPCACTPACPACQICNSVTGQCIPNGATDGQACGEPGQLCAQGSCGCEAQPCLNAGGCCAGAVCVPTDVQSDPAHCGACQTVCAAGEVCLAGVCCLPSTADLQTAITQALPGSTRHLCAGTWNLSATVSIAKDLTLIGAGAGQTILDGGDAVGVLAVPDGATVTLQDLTVTKGKTAFGAGIDNDGMMILRGVAVTDNTSTNQGGGIFTRGDLTLEDGSRVADNSAVAYGGGIANGSGTTTLKNGARVSGNTATGDGGGILNLATLILEDGSIVGGDTPAEANSASRDGGGIANLGNATLKDGSRVAGNSATNDGGGIWNNGATLTLEGGSQVSGNSAEEGGGIWNNFSTVTLEMNALVCDNQQSAGGQCSGPSPFSGVCPFPASGSCAG